MPKSIFVESDEEKISKIADDSLDALEQGQDVYDEEITKEEKNDDDEDSAESDEEVEENLEEEEEEEAPPKKSKKITKVDDEDDELEETTRKPKQTTKKIEITTESVKKIKSSVEATTQKSQLINSTGTTNSFKKSTTGSPKLVPHINVDGTQIAFNPKFNNTTTPETTTERELEINDIADMIFPDRKNVTTNNDDKHVGGTNDAFKDETAGKGAASGFDSSLKTLFACFTACILFIF